MITNAFLFVFFGIVTTALSFLPTVTDTSLFVPSITTSSSLISGVYSFLPVITVTILSILAFDVIFESGYLLFKIVYWVIRRFPTQS